MKAPPQINTESTRRESVGLSSGISLGHGAATVFSTPSMILLMELAAKDLLAPHLEPDEDSVGVTVNIEHLAPTPLHTEVRAVARLDAIEKRQFHFTIEAFDAAGLIGRGKHTRAIVQLGKFKDILQQRHPALSNHASPPHADRIRLEQSSGVAHLILNRPDKLNAIDEPMTDALEHVLYLLERDVSLRLVIMSGEGRSFCAGEDIKENATVTAEQSTLLASRRAAICARLGRLGAPVVARVHGACMGGGFMLALASDWIFATPDARFALPEIDLGWPPAYGMARLKDRIGFAAARDFCLLGTPMSARQAADCHLVSKVIPANLMDQEIQHISKQLLQKPPTASAETRRLLRSEHSDSAHLAAYGRCRAHPDAQAGIAKFLSR